MDAATKKRLKRRLIFTGLILLALIPLAIGVGEIVIRLSMPWLLPPRSAYSKSSGMFTRTVEVKFADLHATPPDLVVIGDSHVETGGVPGGWIDYLGEITGMRIGDLGVAGSCPSQYFILLERLRAEGFDAPVVMVIYIGNDFFDEGLWASLGENKSGYLDARYEALSDPSSPQFWPCLEDKFTWTGWVERHSALYRALVFAKYRLGVKFSEPQPEVSETEQTLTEMMEERCHKPPHSERIDGRLFFFNEHEAQLDDEDPLVQEGKRRVVDLLRERGGEENLRILFAIAREEASVDFHGKPVGLAAPFIERMKEIYPDLIDPNPAFIEAAATEDLYLPDSHWNTAGGRLLAEEIKKALGR